MPSLEPDAPALSAPDAGSAPSSLRVTRTSTAPAVRSPAPLKKPVNTLAIVPKSARITSLGRKAYNVLLYEAQDQGLDKDVFRVPLDRVVRGVDFDSNDHALIKKHLRDGLDHGGMAVAHHRRRGGLERLRPAGPRPPDQGARPGVGGMVVRGQPQAGIAGAHRLRAPEAGDHQPAALACGHRALRDLHPLQGHRSHLSPALALVASGAQRSAVLRPHRQARVPHLQA
jgi:hypothetical protein